MDDIKIVETIDKDKVPPVRGKRVSDYSKILRSVATLNDKECLVLEADGVKYWKAAKIKEEIQKHFPSTNYKVTSRADKKDGKIFIYIHK